MQGSPVLTAGGEFRGEEKGSDKKCVPGRKRFQEPCEEHHWGDEEADAEGLAGVGVWY